MGGVGKSIKSMVYSFFVFISSGSNPVCSTIEKTAETLGTIAFEHLAKKYARYKGGTSQFLPIR